MTAANKRIQFRRGTAEALAAVNEVLLAGELGLETDTGKYKLGDGVTHWSELPYSGLSIPSGDSVYVVKNGEYIAATTIAQDGAFTPNLEHETWTMTLDDDTVLTKEVVTWISPDLNN